MVEKRSYRNRREALMAELGTARPSTWRERGPRYERARPDELWHIDTTIIRLVDGTKAYLHAVIDNFSRRILGW